MLKLGGKKNDCALAKIEASTRRHTTLLSPRIGLGILVINSLGKVELEF
jgi:hypothetical protein